MIIEKLDQSSLKKFSDPANTHVTTESFILDCRPLHLETLKQKGQILRSLAFRH